VFGVLGVEQTNAAHVSRLLRLCDERRKKGESKDDREPDHPHGHLGWLLGW
jgi:hypothetical protein